MLIDLVGRDLVVSVLCRLQDHLDLSLENVVVFESLAKKLSAFVVLVDLGIVSMLLLTLTLFDLCDY